VTGPVTVLPVLGLPEVVAGDDVGALVVTALGPGGLAEGDVVVVSSKLVSKALGLRASRGSEGSGVPGGSRDALVLEESVRVVAERRTADGVTRVVEAAAGPVMAAAGIDGSNTGPGDELLLLPRDPDRCARDLRSSLLARSRMPSSAPLAVVLSDTAGRPWRAGLTDFALGSAGLRVLLDHRGEMDADGRVLSVTARAAADEIAAAADLVKGKADGVGAAIVRGLPSTWFEGEQGSGAAQLVRTGPGDWFATGHVEAVRAALGIRPGSPESEEVGIRAVGLETFADVVRRVVAVTLLHDEDASVDLQIVEGDEPSARAHGARGAGVADGAHGAGVADGGVGGVGGVGADAGIGAEAADGAHSAEVALGAVDDFALGRLAQRLEVAAAGEGLRAVLGPGPTAEHTLTARLVPGS